jgi:hypothetical protein
VCFVLKCESSFDAAFSLVVGSALNKGSQLGHCQGLCLDQGKLWSLICGVCVWPQWEWT